MKINKFVAVLLGVSQCCLQAATLTLTNGNSTVTIQATAAVGMADWTVDGPAQTNRQGFRDGVGGGVDRGLVALAKADNEVYLGWRLLASDPADVAFNVYRDTDDMARVKLNPQPLRESTDFVDRTVSLARNNRWIVHPVFGGSESNAAGIASLPANPPPKAYKSIKLQGDYLFSKVAIADLDGDGKLDFVIKQPQQTSDPGVWQLSTNTFKVEAYRHDGTFLWRRDLGWNIEQGVWWSPMIVADFDGDGKAEVALKTAPLEPIYRNEAGRILAGPEYLSIWDGMTGKDIARVDWPPRGDIAAWGDKVGNRASRHLIGLAKLDGKRTSVLALRGTYTTMLVDAYNLVGGKLEKVWSWNGDHETPPVRGQGMHGMHAADVDGDGREEIILGAAVIDDTGKTLWNLNMGHPDVCYVTDVIPSRPGLEIAYGFETAQEKNGFCVVDAKTGKIIWGCDHLTTHVHSQGLLADIDSTNPGLEFYGGEKFLTNRWVYSATDGKLLSQEDLGSLAPNPIYWDDSYVKPYLTREGDIIKYKGAKLGKIEGRVIAIADILGDWREEIITSVPGELRIYSTTIPATRRHPWLMEDPIYRNDVAHVSMGYLYPPQLTKPLTAETKP
jgi:rhamnogalacturonan endolyase